MRPLVLCQGFGRRRPTGTRQGIYAVSPTGEFLASCNTRSPDRMRRMLEQALKRWKEAGTAGEMPESTAAELRAVVEQRKAAPQDGLILSVIARDLPRDDLPDDWRARAWNVDFAWFSSEGGRLIGRRSCHALPSHSHVSVWNGQPPYSTVTWRWESYARS